MQYQHYKNKKIYTVLGTAIDTNTHETVVVYYDQTGKLFTRPEKEFYGDTPSGKRFTLISQNEEVVTDTAQLLKQIVFDIFHEKMQERRIEPKNIETPIIVTDTESLLLLGYTVALHIKHVSKEPAVLCTKEQAERNAELRRYTAEIEKANPNVRKEE